MGTQLYSKGVFINRCFESLNLTDPDLVRQRAWRIRARRRRCHRNQHVRRQSHQAARLRPEREGRRPSTSRARASRAARRFDAERANADDRAYVAGAIGPLGIRVEPWGKTGIDEAEQFFKEQAEALVGRRRRSVHPRDVPRSERDRRRHRRRPQRLRSADRRADDDRGGRQQPGRHAAGAVCAGAAGARRRGCRRQLQRRSGADARVDRAARRGDAGATLGAAQRRQAARHRRPQHLSLLAGIHGVVRAALHRQRRAPRRRLLRHDARAHPPDLRRRPTQCAGGGARRPAASTRGPSPSPKRRTRKRRCRAAQKSRLAAKLANGEFVDRRRAAAAARAGVRRGDRRRADPRRPPRRRGDRARLARGPARG